MVPRDSTNFVASYAAVATSPASTPAVARRRIFVRRSRFARYKTDTTAAINSSAVNASVSRSEIPERMCATSAAPLKSAAAPRIRR